jgi:TPR repeat protein
VITQGGNNIMHQTNSSSRPHATNAPSDVPQRLAAAEAKFVRTNVANLLATRNRLPLHQDMVIDLHGQSCKDARATVQDTLKSAVGINARQLKIITGRGKHVNRDGSRGVLFKALPGWLKKQDAVIQNLKSGIGFYELALVQEAGTAKDDPRLQELAKARQQIIKDAGGMEAVRAAAAAGDVQTQTFLGAMGLYQDAMPADREQGIAWLRQAADSKHAPAQFLLGAAFEGGVGVKRDYQRAAKWFAQGAEQKEPNCEFYMGKCFMLGQGVKQDDAQGMHWLTRAANHNHALAQLNLGNIHANGWGAKQDQQAANDWYTKAAEQGLVEAQVTLAARYFDGVDEKRSMRNYAKAIPLFESAAAAGDCLSQYYLGFAYDNGYGVTQDHTKAFIWFKRAARQGDKEGQMKVGMAYFYGHGVTKNIPNAIKWLTRAAEQGEVNSQRLLGSIYFAGLAGGVDEAKAFHWFTLAAAQEDAESQHYLGMCYLGGIGVAKDVARAIHYLMLAANQEHVESQMFLATLYAEGSEDIPQDRAAAFPWFYKAAQHDDATAQASVAVSYEQGLGVPVDLIKAVEWYERAAAQGDDYSQTNLAKLYATAGTAVKRDYAKAYRHGLQAAKQGNPTAQRNLGVMLLKEQGDDAKNNSAQILQWLNQLAAKNDEGARMLLQLAALKSAKDPTFGDNKSRAQPPASSASSAKGAKGSVHVKSSDTPVTTTAGKHAEGASYCGLQGGFLAAAGKVAPKTLTPNEAHEQLLAKMRPILQKENIAISKAILKPIEERKYTQALRRICTITDSQLNSMPIQLTRILLEQRAVLDFDINEKAGKEEKAAIHYAACSGSKALYDVLVAHGANPDLKDATGFAAVTYMARHLTTSTAATTSSISSSPPATQRM